MSTLSYPTPCLDITLSLLAFDKISLVSLVVRKVTPSKEFILSKFYAVLVFAGFSTLFVFIVSLVLGFIYSDYNEFSIITSDLQYLLGFFIKLVGFFSFGLFVGILVKRSAFAVGAMFVWLIAESIFKGYLFYAFRGSDTVSESVDGVMKFLPFEAMSKINRAILIISPC